MTIAADKLVNGFDESVELVFGTSLNFSEISKAGLHTLRQAGQALGQLGFGLGHTANEIGDGRHRRLKPGEALFVPFGQGLKFGDALSVLLAQSFDLGLGVQNELHGFLDIHDVNYTAGVAHFTKLDKED